jgi:hypothetical protein
MENDMDNIAAFAQKTGLTEDEVIILDHLIQAGNLYFDLPDNYDKDVPTFASHQQALIRLLMWRIVKRDHPEGWRPVGELEDREL